MNSSWATTDPWERVDDACIEGVTALSYPCLNFRMHKPVTNLTPCTFAALFQSRPWPAVCGGQSTSFSSWTVLRGWDWRTTKGPRSSSPRWLTALTWLATGLMRGMPAWLCCSTAAPLSSGWSSSSHTTWRRSQTHWHQWTTWTPPLPWAAPSSMLSTIWWCQRYRYD